METFLVFSEKMKKANGTILLANPWFNRDFVVSGERTRKSISNKQEWIENSTTEGESPVLTWKIEFPEFPDKVERKKYHLLGNGNRGY